LVLQRLVLRLALECYQFTPMSRSAIRSTKRKLTWLSGLFSLLFCRQALAGFWLPMQFGLLFCFKAKRSLSGDVLAFINRHAFTFRNTTASFFLQHSHSLVYGWASLVKKSLESSCQWRYLDMHACFKNGINERQMFSAKFSNLGENDWASPSPTWLNIISLRHKIAVFRIWDPRKVIDRLKIKSCSCVH